jgi:hypothetical protein
VTTSEILSVALSVLSLVVAGIAAYRTYELSRFQLHVGTRHEFQKLLLELNKELIRDPELWGVYDSHPLAQTKRDDPLHKAKLEGFVYMKLNILQIVFAFHSTWQATARDSIGDMAWHGTAVDFVNDSRLAREVILRPDSAMVYDPRFLAYLKSLIKG